MTSLNIKNEETVRLVRELSQRTGESLTGAIHLAVKAELDRQKPKNKASLARRLMEIGRETAVLMNDGRTSKQLMDALYDPETGLPA